MDRYLYAYANPTVYVDLMGYDPMWYQKLAYDRENSPKGGLMQDAAAQQVEYEQQQREKAEIERQQGETGRWSLNAARRNGEVSVTTEDRTGSVDNEQATIKDGLFQDKRIIKTERMPYIEMGVLNKTNVKHVVIHQTMGSSVQSAKDTWEEKRTEWKSETLTVKVEGREYRQTRKFKVEVENNPKHYGAHFVIGKNGEINQFARVDQVAYHTGTKTPQKIKNIQMAIGKNGERIYTETATNEKSPVLNQNSIGIEFVGQYMGGKYGYEEPTAQQIEAYRYLLNLLKNEFAIEEVYRHPEVAIKTSSEAFWIPKSFSKIETGLR